jgi:hypothetical protein
MFRPIQCFPRARCAAVRRSALFAAPRFSQTVIGRTPRGLLTFAKVLWRRCATGSNHISAFGVWRDHARRSMARINRTGETRWHRLPSTGQAAISEKDAL